MKQTHSTTWRRSVQPRKQRKYLHNLPDHLLGSQLRVHLAAPLKKKHGLRALRVRTGDKVRVLRGTFKGKEGKVERVDTRAARVYVSKVEMKKLQGGTAPYPLRPSNLLLLELAEERLRMKRRKQGAEKPSPQERTDKNAVAPATVKPAGKQAAGERVVKSDGTKKSDGAE